MRDREFSLRVEVFNGALRVTNNRTGREVLFLNLMLAVALPSDEVAKAVGRMVLDAMKSQWVTE